MKTREEQIEELAKAIYATGVALEGTDYAFGVYDNDDHFHRMANALIAANIGDVTAYQAEAEYWKIICRFESDEHHTIIKNAAEHARHLMQERDEYKHRAEVAERALSWLCGETMRDIRIIMYPSIKKQVRDKQELYDHCIAQAEQELAEEVKDD